MKAKVIAKFTLFRGHQTIGFRRFAKHIDLPAIPPLPFHMELKCGEAVTSFQATIICWSEPEDCWHVYCDGPNEPTQVAASIELRKAIKEDQHWTLVQEADWPPR